MSVEPRPPLLTARRAVHGSPDYGEMERLGIDPSSVLDFSVNANAYGPSPLVSAALAGVAIDRYPDAESSRLRRALGDHNGVPLEWVAVGNGAAELIWLLAAAFLRAGDRVAVLGPTFAEYERASQAYGALVHPVDARGADGFAPDIAAFSAALGLRPRLAFICNPNNPTGSLLPPEWIDACCRDHPDTLLVVDESYLAFAAAAPSALGLGHDNLLVLRSMTKDYALAGLRLGYAVAPSEPVLTAIRAVQPPWSVSVVAQAAGLAALGDPEHLARTLTLLRTAKDDLVAALQRLGLRPVPSATHFFLVDVGDAASFRRGLLQRGILVRDCASFGLPRHVRIASRRPEENERLVEAVRGLLR